MSLKVADQTSNVNPLDDENKEDVDINQIYSDEDKKYLSFLQQRLMDAKLQNNKIYPEFNNKSRTQYSEENIKIANTTHLGNKLNEDDVIVGSGTVETKLDALLSYIDSFNLSSEIIAFDKDNVRLTQLGLAIEDVVHDTKIQDGGDGGGDADKRTLRQRELLTKGTTFVQETWLRKFEIKKKLKEKYKGQFKDFAGWSKEVVKVFEGPTRTLLNGLDVYLGNVTEFYMESQPYIFTVTHMDYDVAETIYGKFDNWKYVKKGAIEDSVIDDAKTIFDNKFRLTELRKNQVEIVIYQDRTRDEFQTIINGVLMMPIGFPLSAVSPRGDYNVVKQVFRVLNTNFAFGGSFVSQGSVREISNLIDEMLKLFVLKTRKSITAAYVNTSGRVIPTKVLSPGRISMGLDPQALQPIAGNEVQGVTAGEANFLEKMQSLIDRSTVSQQFTGQQAKSGTTATEVLKLQEQARLTLSLTITACSLLEQKLDYLRLYNILENWFDPVGTKVEGIDEARKVVNTFRSTNREVSIPGEGMGERNVILKEEGEEFGGETDEFGVSSGARFIRKIERDEEKKKGFPVRKIFINPKAIRNAKLLWYVVTNAQPRESSSLFKDKFRETLNDLLQLTALGIMPNKDNIEEEYSKLSGKSRTKLFQKGDVAPELAGVPQAGASTGRASQSGVPEIPAGVQS